MYFILFVCCEGLWLETRIHWRTQVFPLLLLTSLGPHVLVRTPIS